MNRTVTLVDTHGSPIGEADIVEAHLSPGKLHRAFSVFVFSDDQKTLMLQKRFTGKPTFGSLWANTCCSHQLPNEDDVAAGTRRLQEEMGFSVPLEKKASFIYQADDPRKNGMSEHEHDTILLGTADESISVTMNPQEVEDWKWMTVEDLQTDLKVYPEKYVPWLSIALRHIL